MAFKPDGRGGIHKTPSGRAGVGPIKGSNLQRVGNRVIGNGGGSGGAKTSYKGSGFKNPIGRK